MKSCNKISVGMSYNNGGNVRDLSAFDQDLSRIRRQTRAYNIYQVHVFWFCGLGFLEVQANEANRKP